jgi:hypothetical protein
MMFSAWMRDLQGKESGELLEIKLEKPVEATNSRCRVKANDFLAQIDLESWSGGWSVWFAHAGSDLSDFSQSISRFPHMKTNKNEGNSLTAISLSVLVYCDSAEPLNHPCEGALTNFYHHQIPKISCLCRLKCFHHKNHRKVIAN